MKKYLIGCMMGALVLTGTAWAETPVVVPAAPAVAVNPNAAAIARVEQYLSDLTTVVADFSQVSGDGSTGKGKFYLKRPGKMRWQYAPPTPILLVSNGSVVTYYDASLDQVSYVNVDDTMMGFLAQKTISLESESTHVTNFEADGGLIRVTLIRKAKPNDGKLTLEFMENPLEIRKMIAVDATGQETRIQLQNAQFGLALDDKLFTFEDPRGVTPRKNRRN